jgi:AcrR family transcriptional regulator
MSGTSVRDRRAERNEQTRREILEAAWELVREQGLGALAMRDLGARVGMRAQSLYSYFASKNSIFDAMFAEANRELLRRADAMAPLDDADEALHRDAREWVGFAVEDPVRYQLLYQRTIPGFEPSPESYQLAAEALERARAALAACGITEPGALDAWTAVTGGLAAQQTSNDPGGDRWSRLVDEITDMYLAYYRPDVQGERHE